VNTRPRPQDEAGMRCGVSVSVGIGRGSVGIGRGSVGISSESVGIGSASADVDGSKTSADDRRVSRPTDSSDKMDCGMTCGRCG
jgi:uncharacterized protein (UPF0254 family)